LGERGAITLGLLGGAVGYFIFGASRTGFLFWLGIPFLNMLSFAWPAMQSVLSHKGSPSEQGPLQGALNSLRGIAGLLGPGLFTFIFSKSIGPNAFFHSPGIPFYAAAVILLVALIIAQRADNALRNPINS
jgi:DHA1 family tetracycline resistance protein-like MFS transporter